jgi:broad specificity phosphatase PhoE
MGIIAGLPEKEMERLYPDIAAGIRAWRANPGKMAHPVVPGSESNTSFADRIRAGLERSIMRAQKRRQSIAIVATTSTLTMLNHLLVNDGKLQERTYAFTNPPLGSVAAWCVSVDAPVQTMPTTIPT